MEIFAFVAGFAVLWRNVARRAQRKQHRAEKQSGQFDHSSTTCVQMPVTTEVGLVRSQRNMPIQGPGGDFRDLQADLDVTPGCEATGTLQRAQDRGVEEAIMAHPKNKPHKVSFVDSDLSPNFVDEGAASGTEVGITASATFKHAKGLVTYSLTDDAGGAFTIDPLSGVVTVANEALLDYETAHSQTISVSVTDGKVSALQSFDVAIGDVAEITVQRVSVASDGTEGNSHSYSPAISADGRYVAYLSDASNLVPGDTNDANDIFVFDRQMGTTERVPLASDGTQGNGFFTGGEPAISADGRYIAYSSGRLSRPKTSSSSTGRRGQRSVSPTPKRSPRELLSCNLRRWPLCGLHERQLGLRWP